MHQFDLVTTFRTTLSADNLANICNNRKMLCPLETANKDNQIHSVLQCPFKQLQSCQDVTSSDWNKILEKV